MKQEHHPCYLDALSELEQIESILLNKSKRALSATQIGIILRKRFSAFTSHMNAASDANIPTDERVEFYQVILPKINTIMGYQPDTSPELFWYQLQSLRFSLISNLMAVWGKGGLLRTIGTAHALSNILFGLDTIDSTAIIVDPDHPEFLARNALAINLNNFYAGLHYIASTSLYSITRDRLIDWGTKALIGNEKMFQIIDLVWDIPLHRSFDKRLGENRTFNLCGVLINIFNAMIRYLILLIARFNTSWPDIVEHVSFLDPSNYDTLISSLETIIDTRDSYIDDLQHHISSGTFDANNNPLDNPLLKRNLVFSELYSFIVRGLRLSYTIVQSDSHQPLDDLGQLLTDFLTYLDKHKEIIVTPSFITSIMAEILESLLEHFIYQLGIYCYHKKSLAEFDLLEQAVSIYFTDEGIEHFPQLYILFLQAKLFVATSLQNKSQSYELACKISKTIPKNLFQPRDSFCLLLMAELTKLSLGKIQIATFKSTMSKKITEVKQFLVDSYMTKIQRYLDDIYTVYESQSNPQISREIAFSPFDPQTFFIPDLASFFSQSNLEPIPYIPFNLATDAIIE